MRYQKILFAGFILTCFILFQSSGYAELPLMNSTARKVKIENVHFGVENGNVIINYDLLGYPAKNYIVRIFLKKGNDVNYQYEPRIVSGDVGKGKFAGRNKRIVWAFNKEFPDGLPGKDYYFVVNAEELNKSPHLLAWIGVGMAAIAATATYMVVVKKSSLPNNNSPDISFPPPPGRPK